MPDFFFLSPQNDTKIRYMKITVEFDNFGEGFAKFSIKIWLEKTDFEELPQLYLLICNRENPVSLELIDVEYNRFLIEKKFREAAGMEDTEEKEEYQKYAVEEIEKFEEDPGLVGRYIIYPKNILVKEIDSDILAKEILRRVGSRNILVKILPIDEETKIAMKNNLKEKIILGFQFRILLRDFLSQETLRSFRSSSDSWSAEIDIHKVEGHEDIYEGFKDILKYPDFLDLWINIPHNHLFIGSSPIYEKAIKLKREDIGYKTYEEYEEREREFYKKFETIEGDYSVLIKNKEGKPQNFSMICISPFLPGEKPSELKEGIEEFKKKSEDLEDEFKKKSEDLEKSQRNLLRNMIEIFGIFVAIFSFVVISANYALRIPLPEQVSSFKYTFLHISALLFPIFLFLLVLLIIVYFINKR